MALCSSFNGILAPASAKSSPWTRLVFALVQVSHLATYDEAHLSKCENAHLYNNEGLKSVSGRHAIETDDVTVDT